MARIIPNNNTFVYYVATLATYTAPTGTELGTAINLTPFLMSINASTRGNVVPTPSFDTLYETSIQGTVTSTFEADFYRDSGTGTDTAWTTLPMGTNGYFVISRFGGKGGPGSTPVAPLNAPITGDKVEVWPVQVVSRSMANLANNTVMSFTVTCSVPKQPAESATVA